MRPYFEEDRIAIYHGDCREILPQLERGCVDLVVTDPPYGVKWRSNHRNDRFDYITGDDSTEAAIVAAELIIPSLKRFAHLYFFGRYEFGPLFSEAVELIWDKGMMNSGNLESPWGNQHEYIQFHVFDSSKQNISEGKGRLSARKRKGSVISVPRLNSGAVAFHPTQKPIRLLREIIESSSCIGDTVLDCFAGSGSTLVAAQVEGRRAIGIEIEERYCEIAAKRLAQSVLPLEVA